MQDISTYYGLYCGSCRIFIDTQKKGSLFVEYIGNVKRNGYRSEMTPALRKELESKSVN